MNIEVQIKKMLHLNRKFSLLWESFINTHRKHNDSNFTSILV